MSLFKRRLRREIENVKQINEESLDQIEQREHELQKEKKEREEANARLEAISMDLDILSRRSAKPNGV